MSPLEHPVGWALVSTVVLPPAALVVAILVDRFHRARRDLRLEQQRSRCRTRV